VGSDDKPQAIWATRKGEPPHVKAAFERYLSQRVLLQLAEEIGVSRPTIYLWAKRWEWRERAALYDESVASEARRVTAEASPGSGLPEVLDRSRRIFRALSDHALARLGDQAAQEAVDATTSRLDLEDRDVLRAAAEWGKVLVTWVAAALAAAAAQGPRDDRDLSRLTDEELEEAHRLASIAEAG